MLSRFGHNLRCRLEKLISQFGEFFVKKPRIKQLYGVR